MITVVPTKSPALTDAAGRIMSPSPARQQSRRASALRALFWFHFQPFVILAVCLAAIVGLLVAIAEVRHHVLPKPSYDPEISALLVSWGQVLMMIGCPIAGVCLGVFQARPDADEKMWPLLIHRPTSSRIFFAGRVLAGVALYGIAAGVPMAVFFGYAFFQHGVPYHWTFMLPGLADFSTGLVYYLAGSLAVTRMGRIYGSRLLPLAGAAACSVLVLSVPRFYEAMGLVGIFLVIYGIALHGAHATKGYQLKGATAGRLATGMTLFAGLALIGVVVSFFARYRAALIANEQQDEVYIRAETLTPGWQRLAQTQSVTRFLILPDGSLGKSIYTPPPPDIRAKLNFEEYPYQIFFRVGPPEVEVRPTKEDLSEASRHTGYMDMIAPQSPYREIGAQEGRIQVPFVSSALDSAALAAQQTNIAVRNQAEKWWYLKPSGVIQGFEIPSGKLIGTLGMNGFHSGRFGVRGLGASMYSSEDWMPTHSLTSDGSYSINLGQRTVTPTWTFPTGEKIIAVCAPYGFQERFAIAANKMFVYLDDTLLMTVPLTHSAASSVLKITRFAAQHRWVISYTSRDDAMKGGSFAYYDDSWNLLSETSIPAMYIVSHDPGYPPAWMAAQEKIRADFARNLGSTDALCSLPVVYPLQTLAGNAPLRVFAHDEISGMDSFPVMVQSHEAAYWRSAAWNLLATLLAMIPLAIAFRARFKALWVLSAALFGPMMLLVLLCTHPWPARTKCPAWRRIRWIGGQRCVRCSMPFGQPGAEWY